MAELRKMGVRLTAEGVSQYKDDLRSAGREARQMSQETRLAMAELGSGASSTDKLTTRLKSLGKQYEAEKSRVSLLTNSQKEFKTSLNLVGREIKTTSSKLKDSQKETNRLENNYRKMGETLGWNAEETKKAKREWEASKNETKKLSQSLSDLEKEQGQYSKELDKMPGKLNSAKISMQEKANEMAKLREEYIKNGGALGKYADKIQQTSGKIRNFSQGMANTGDALTKGVTLPIVAGVTAVVKAASDWESAFAGTRKTVDEVVDANGNVVYSYKELEDGLRSLAKELPATHDEIAGVAEAAGQLGIETESVTSFTKTMIDMGESTNMSAETAASSLARLANITGMNQKDFDRLGSTIVALGNNFATTEAEVTEMALRLAGTGNQIGLTESEILALGAAMSSVGIQAEAGGTAMSMVLKKMQNAVADGSEELTGFAKVSRMSADEFAEAFKSDPSRALQSFIEGLEESSGEGENLNGILKDLGITGIRESDTLLRLAGNSALLGQALDMSGDAWEDNTALAEEAATRYETLESQLGILRNEAKDIAIEFGGPFVKALRESLKAAKPMLETVSDMAENFSELDEETQETILKFIGITAAAGPALSILGRFGKGAATTGDGLAWLVRKVGGLKASAELASPAVTTAETSIAGFGSAAKVAGGAKGIGGLSAALGTALPWIAGATLLVGAGYGAWKLWGEGAYESGQRTKRWGHDVGEAADEALTEMSESTSEIGNQYHGMGVGIEADTDSMMKSFTNLGSTIQSELNERIEKFGQVAEEYSDILSENTKDMLADEQKSLQESLDNVTSYSERANEIREKESKSSVNMSAETAKQLADLSKATAEEYVKTLGGTQEEQERILSALTGDIDSATQDQARTWAQSLGKQRQELVKHSNEIEKAAEEVIENLGIDPDGEVAEQVRKDFEGINKEAINGLDAQLAAIADKYPEIADEIIFSNGQVATETMKMGDVVRNSNEKIIASGRNMSNAMRESSLDAAEDMSWMADEGKKGAENWNNLIYEAKQGDFETDLPELVKESAKDAVKWNQLRFNLHDADLNSNAKSIIGEAAIANGRWDGMTYKEKKLVLQDDFTIQMYDALEETGKWQEMELEEKTAVMYSNTPEKMTETLLYLGLWDEYETEIKEVKADNYDFMNTIRQSEEKMQSWESVDDSTKALLGDNYDLLTAIFESEERFNIFKSIPDEEKKMLAENTDLLNKVTESKVSYENWNGLPENTKKLIVSNYDAIGPILESDEAYNRWLELPSNEKTMLANNTDLMAKVLSSEKEYNEWVQLDDSNKNIKAKYESNAWSVIPGIESYNTVIGQTPTYTSSESVMYTNAEKPTSQVNRWTKAQDGVYSTNTKATTSTNAPTPTSQVNKWTGAQDQTYSTNTRATTSTNAPGPTSLVNQWTDAQGQTHSTDTSAHTSAPGAYANTRAVSGWTNEVNRAPKKKKSVFTTIRETITKFFTKNNATGNPYFEGGTTWLGDGGKREPYLTPDGQFGVSGSSDELYDLPRGTRIWPSRQSFTTSASQNESLRQYLGMLPKFATGGTIQNPYDGYTGLVGEAGPEIFQIAQGKVSITPITQGQRTQTLNNVGGQASMDETNQLLQSLIQLVAQGQVIQMDKREVGRTIYDEVDSMMNGKFKRKNIMNMQGGG